MNKPWPNHRQDLIPPNRPTHRPIEAVPEYYCTARRTATAAVSQIHLRPPWPRIAMSTEESQRTDCWTSLSHPLLSGKRSYSLLCLPQELQAAAAGAWTIRTFSKKTGSRICSVVCDAWPATARRGAARMILPVPFIPGERELGKEGGRGHEYSLVGTTKMLT